MLVIEQSKADWLMVRAMRLRATADELEEMAQALREKEERDHADDPES